MRVLTVRQPWAWAIIHGGKDVENRTRNIAGDYRGPVAIHAGLRYDHDAVHFDPLNEAELAAIEREKDLPGDHECRTLQPLGALIGVVDLVDVHHGHPSGMKCTARTQGGMCSPWAMSDHHHLVLANPRALADPIPARGRLGLWRPDGELKAQIEAALS